MYDDWTAANDIPSKVKQLFYFKRDTHDLKADSLCNRLHLCKGNALLY